MLLVHIPLYIESLVDDRRQAGLCGHPNWGAAADNGWETEQREKVSLQSTCPSSLAVFRPIKAWLLVDLVGGDKCTRDGGVCGLGPTHTGDRRCARGPHPCCAGRPVWTFRPAVRDRGWVRWRRAPHRLPAAPAAQALIRQNNPERLSPVLLLSVIRKCLLFVVMSFLNCVFYLKFLRPPLLHGVWDCVCC